MQIQGFQITETRVKNKSIGLRDILMFPLLIIGTPFIAIGVFFFSVLDKLKNNGKSDWAKLTETWNEIVFELTVIDQLNQTKFTVDPEIDLYSIESMPSIPLFKEFYVGDYLFTEQHGFFLGFNKESECMQLIILTKSNSYSVDLGEGNWTFENDHHHANDYCQLRNWGNKTSTTFTFKPVNN